MCAAPEWGQPCSLRINSDLAAGVLAERSAAKAVLPGLSAIRQDRSGRALAAQRALLADKSDLEGGVGGARSGQRRRERCFPRHLPAGPRLLLDADYAACRADGLWQPAFDAKTRSLDGQPEQIPTGDEAQAWPRLAALLARS